LSAPGVIEVMLSMNRCIDRQRERIRTDVIG
jgi:hypothetical protein